MLVKRSCRLCRREGTSGFMLYEYGGSQVPNTYVCQSESSCRERQRKLGFRPTYPSRS